jgi:hypothetical protein
MPREPLLVQGDPQIYPPGYPEKNKKPIDPLHAEINRLVRTGVPFMTAFKDVYRAAAAAPKNNPPK